MFRAELRIADYNLPLIEGNISYKNNFQYDVSIKLPRLALDYAEVKEATIVLTNNTYIYEYPFKITKITGDDLFTIQGGDFTQHLDDYYYKWIDIIDNMKATEIQVNSDGEVNITKYVHDAIVQPTLSAFTDKTITWEDEYVKVQEDTFKQYVFGIIDEFMSSPSLVKFLNLINRFGTTIVYDGYMYSVVGAYEMWRRYTEYQIDESYIMRIGNYELDLTHNYDQVIVKNLAYITFGNTDNEFIAKYPDDSELEDIENKRVRLIMLNTPVFNKDLLQRVATIVYLDEHAQMTRSTIALNSPNPLSYYYGVRINITNGIAFWLANRPVSYQWWQQDGDVLVAKEQEIESQIGSSFIGQYNVQGFDITENILSVVGNSFIAQLDMNKFDITENVLSVIGNSFIANTKAENTMDITENVWTQIGSTLAGTLFF